MLPDALGAAERNMQIFHVWSGLVEWEQLIVSSYRTASSGFGLGVEA